MLPDYPNTKRLILDKIHQQMREKTKAGIFSRMGHKSVFEGDRYRIIRSDGSVQDSSYHEASAELSIDLREYESLSFEDILSKIEEVSADLHRQQSEYFFASISEMVEGVGNQVDVKGQKPQGKHLLEMLEKIQVVFDENGQVIPPTIVVNPKGEEAFHQAVKEIMENPDLKMKHDKIMRQKYEEWRDRESSRKLVG